MTERFGFSLTILGLHRWFSIALVRPIRQHQVTHWKSFIDRKPFLYIELLSEASLLFGRL